ncbi:MAG TPA: asparagine synthase (glutamine-hydrolyzing) [Methylophilaceae bacterium]|nr:asparagine synthase (glutamine-hydrolyzing) [Methylophilaceae bacterium]
MCGIAGYVATISPRTAEDIDACMRQAIRYRGRDGEGKWVCPSGRARLLHSRLSIIDLESGGQPMIDVSGRYVIVFNGEIYNYLELRKAYTAAGARFHTSSDTEVILEGYKLKGEAVCQDLNGMFAFAVWDTKENTLFLSRDRLGKKPLYWTTIGGGFYFASSIDAFHAIPGWTGALSALNLDAYAALGSYLPGETAFRQVRSLPAASHAKVELKSLSPQISRYWRLDFSHKSKLSLEAALEAFEGLFANAVDIRLRADVPVALTFSGGVDSGIIAAVAKKFSGKALSCWTIDYDTPEDPSEETDIARRVASQLGLEWHYKHFDYHHDLIPALREALQYVDQPCGHIAVSYSRRLYAAIRPAAKVVLSGNGADELFLGYAGNEQLAARDSRSGLGAWQRLLASWQSRTNSHRTRALADYQTDYIRANLGNYSEDGETEERVQAIHRDIVASGVTSHADLYTYMGLSFYTTEANFRIPDITGLSEQVEVRSPFLDYRVVEFAASLPTHLKIASIDSPTGNKRLLKHYYERYVDQDIAWAPKKGMGWNLKYDRTLAADPDLEKIYKGLLQRIRAAGMPDEKYRQAWQDFLRDKRAGIAFPSSAGTMSAGLMLGLWLDRGQVAALA